MRRRGCWRGRAERFLLAYESWLRPARELYPEFVHELEDESGLRVDLRDQGTILISSGGEFPAAAERISV